MIQTYEGRVTRILQEKNSYQKLEIYIPNNKAAIVENGKLPSVNYKEYQVNDKVILTETKTSAGRQLFISDYVRRDPLIWLLILFVVVVVIVARKRGLFSLLGMLLSFLVIFGYILPNISQGKDPILVAITGSLIIIPLTFILSHGLNRKTFTAIGATLVTLIFTGLLAVLFIELTKLTGFSSEEAAFLQLGKKGLLEMKGLLLAGIIIGVLGVLDDITVAQAAVVFQLKKTDPGLGFVKLYRQTMQVGHDHISSMVNTLVLVYAGASLPLLLLFINNPRPLSFIINYEFIAEEIVRTLVASIGLVMAVPLTTLFASYIATNRYFSEK